MSVDHPFYKEFSLKGLLYISLINREPYLMLMMHTNTQAPAQAFLQLFFPILFNTLFG
jgi:hypothetical protein